MDPVHACFVWGCGVVDYTSCKSDSVTLRHYHCFFVTSSCLSTGPTPASPTSSSSGDSTHSSHLSEGNNRLRWTGHVPYRQKGPKQTVTYSGLLLSCPLCSAVKRQFQLQVAEVIPLLTSDSKKKTLSEELARTPLFVEQDSSARLMLAEESVAVTPHLLELWSWYEVSFLKLTTGVLLGLPALKEFNQFVKNRTYSLQHTPLPECFLQGPLTADQLTPPPGYTPLRLTLLNHPEDVPMGRLWSLKEQLCSSLTLQPYALLLKGYMEGSTHIIFHISRHVTLDEDQVAAMFVVAKRAGLYPHSITTGFSTFQEVSQWSSSVAVTPSTDLSEVPLCLLVLTPSHHISHRWSTT